MDSKFVREMNEENKLEWYQTAAFYLFGSYRYKAELYEVTRQILEERKEKIEHDK